MTKKTTNQPMLEREKQYTPLAGEVSPEHAFVQVNQVASKIKAVMKSKGAKLK